MKHISWHDIFSGMWTIFVPSVNFAALGLIWVGDDIRVGHYFARADVLAACYMLSSEAVMPYALKCGHICSCRSFNSVIIQLSSSTCNEQMFWPHIMWSRVSQCGHMLASLLNCHPLILSFEWAMISGLLNGWQKQMFCPCAIEWGVKPYALENGHMLTSLL